MSQKLFARGVVSTMNPVFKNKTGMSAANKALKNAKISGLNYYKPNSNIQATITPANLPKRGLQSKTYLESPQASLGNNLYTRRGDLVPLQRFKDADAVAALKRGRSNSARQVGSPISSLAMSPGNESLNSSALHGAINSRTPGSLVAQRDSVIGGVRNMKETLISNKTREMNPIRRVLGGKKELQEMSLNQLFRS